MNKLILALLLLATSFLFAQDPQGVHAKVELISGTKQNASFLGIYQDTVSLGGIIQGKFTIIKIPRNRFKSIVDDQGNDLLNETADIQKSVKDTTVVADSASSTDSTSSADSASPSDSTVAVNKADSTTETRGTIPEEFKQEHIPTFLDSVAGKHVFVSLERRSIDSALAEELSRIAIRLLQEQGTPVLVAKRTNFGYCREQACIRDSLAAYGAASVFQGNISAAKAQDSLVILMSHTQFADSAKRTSNSAKMNLSSFTAISDAISENRLSDFLKKLQGQQIEIADKRSYIRVETDPEGANLDIEGGETICKTPCTFATLDTGKVVLYAYWSVDRHIWAARSAVPIIPGDTNKVSLKLKQSKPELFITSTPEGAEIYAGSAPISKKTKAIGHTPRKYTVFEPGFSTVQLKKEGFRDTLVTVYTSPTGITNLDVQMDPITDPAEQLKQQEWLRTRKKDFVGKALMGSSIAPILLGTLFSYLAYEDYDDARKIKEELSLPATSNGENYKKLVKKNHDKVDRGDEKMIIGGSLIGTGLLMFGIGFTLSF